MRAAQPGDLVPVAGILELRHGKLDTLALGASLMVTTEDALRADTDLGTEAGVRVLADLGPRGDSALADWRDAIATLSGLGDTDRYVARVYKILRYGGSFAARDGETVVIPAHPEIAPGLAVVPPPSHVQAVEFPGSQWFATDCSGKCDTYRPDGAASVDTILIHDTEGGWDASVATLQYDAGKSVHYIIDADGSRWGQFTPESYTTWHAGNYCYNKHSVGIEHVGVASDPNGYSDALYAKSAEMVKSIATRWPIVIDRDHIVGHYQVPNGNNISQCSPACSLGLDACESSKDYGGAANHTDPGYYWQWCQYMERLGASCHCNDAWPLWNCTTDKTEAWRCNGGTLEKGNCTGGCDVMPNGQNDVCHVATGGAGAAGATGSGGASGAAGNAPDAGGWSGAAGVGAGGTAGNGGAAASGGTAGSAGAAASGGAAGGAGAAPKGGASSDGGCSCSAPGRRGRAPTSAALALLGAVAIAGARRRRSF